jgi:hypothetical protein
VVLKVPSASTRIFLRVHPCAYTGPHRTYHGVLPSWYISITTFEFCRDDTTRESYVAALFDWINIRNFSSYPFQLLWIPPDGSNQCLFLLAMQPKFLALIFCWLLSIWCATALPMGVAPEAIAKKFGYRLNRIDKFAPYTSSRIICWFFSLLNGFSPCVRCKPPSRRQGKPMRLDRIFAYPLIPSRFFSLFLYVPVFLIR